MRHSAFIPTGRKEKAGNTSGPGPFHHAHCFNVGEGVKSSSDTTCQCRVGFMFYFYWSFQKVVLVWEKFERVWWSYK